MSIFIFLDVPHERRKTCCVRLLSLHQLEIGIAENEPFCAGSLKIDLDTRMGALAFAIEDDAIAEFLVVDALSQAHTELAACFCDWGAALTWTSCSHGSGNLYSWANLFDMFARDLRDES